MHASLALLLAFAIGIVAGLRSMTAPAVTAWAAHLGRLNLQNSALAFMGSMWAAGIFTLAALGELVADKLPMTPARTKPGPLAARIVMGGLCGACVVLAAEGAAWLGAVIGGVGAFVVDQLPLRGGKRPQLEAPLRGVKKGVLLRQQGARSPAQGFRQGPPALISMLTGRGLPPWELHSVCPSATIRQEYEREWESRVCAGSTKLLIASMWRCCIA